jgi:transposase-like protein
MSQKIYQRYTPEFKEQAVGEQSEADTFLALRRENARLQAENDILKKAAIILGTKPQLNSAK